MKLRTIILTTAVAALGASAWAQGASPDPMAKPAAPAAASAPMPQTAPPMAAPPAKAAQAKPAAKHKVAKAKHKKAKVVKTAHKAMPAPAVTPAPKDAKKPGA